MLLSLSPVLAVVLFSWIFTQFMKLVFAWLTQGKFSLHYLITTGGMPSSHSAIVCSLATMVGLVEGFDSALFGVTVALAIIVLHDAVVIRAAAGSQAHLVNKLMKQVLGEGEEKRRHLREQLGHKPGEVFVGSVIGIIISLIYWNYII